MEQQHVKFKEDENKCLIGMSWFLQIFVWIFIILLFTLQPKIVPLIILITSFIIYMILELRSKEVKYLLNKITSKQISGKIQKYFNTKPRIEFECECYHSVEEEHESVDEKGNEDILSQGLKFSIKQNKISLITHQKMSA